MSEKHTPGPWVVGKVNRKKQRADINTDACDARLGYTSWTGLARVYGCDENKRVGTEIMEANAMLIAAAPGLLKIAIAALALHPEWDEARAIVAKPTGEQQ